MGSFGKMKTWKCFFFTWTKEEEMPKVNEFWFYLILSKVKKLKHAITLIIVFNYNGSMWINHCIIFAKSIEKVRNENTVMVIRNGSHHFHIFIIVIFCFFLLNFTGKWGLRQNALYARKIGLFEKNFSFWWSVWMPKELASFIKQ